MHLGDSHNFGRRVVRRGRRIAKPRTLLWEWLVLGRDSPLRKVLGRSFDFLPRLGFFRASGEVSRVELEHLGALKREGKRELARITGRAIALFSWLGVSDLHWENLVLGVDARGGIVFGPLDVETILADLSLPTDTKLLPDADPEYAELCRHSAGVRRVLPYLGKPVSAPLLVDMAGAYRATLAFLDGHASEIARVFERVPHLRDTPIRVLLRATGDYVRARTEPVWPPLLDAESEQLVRGDIPYFFRLLGRPGIRYFTDRALRHHGRLPMRGDVPRLDPILSLARKLRAPSRKTLRDEGLLTLLGAFDHPSLSGTHETEDLSVTFGARRLAVDLPSGEELRSPRDLSAVVASVYLPCRCGEDRAVFARARGHTPW